MLNVIAFSEFVPGFCQFSFAYCYVGVSFANIYI